LGDIQLFRNNIVTKSKARPDKMHLLDARTLRHRQFINSKTVVA